MWQLEAIGIVASRAGATAASERRSGKTMATTMTAPSRVAVRMKVNGVEYAAEVEPRLLLVSFLRDNLGLTGTHIGCDTSQCGACVIHFNGEPVKSCTLLTVQANGAELTTIEGISKNGEYDEGK